MSLYKTETWPTGVKTGLWELTETWEALWAADSWTARERSELSARGSTEKKMQYLATRLLLREMLGEKVPVHYNREGRPVLEAGKPHVSVSHSADMIAVALYAAEPVGIDIERLPRPALGKAKDYFLAARELYELGDTDDLLLLHLYWSAKEAMYKYAGDPTLNLKTDFYLYPPRAVGPEGILQGVMLSHGTRHLELAYRIMKDYVLVVTLGCVREFF